DDRYPPGFWPGAVPVLDSDPGVAGVCCAVELIDAARPVERWHLDAIEASLPGNILLRTQTARQIGGFSTEPAFRGRAAGEDVAFRNQLAALGRVMIINRPLYRYLARRGSHLDFFLDRAVRRDGRIELTTLTPEESD